MCTVAPKPEKSIVERNIIEESDKSFVACKQAVVSIVCNLLE